MWKEAKEAFVKQAPEQSRKSTATSNLATPKPKWAQTYAELMDLCEWCSHVFGGGVLSNSTLHPLKILNRSRSVSGPET
jgi:hypothetical protein